MTNAIIPTREQLQDFIYYRHKDAYGVKGRFYDFESMSYDELNAEAIRIDEAAKEQEAHERRCDAEAIIEFRARVRKVQEFCGCTRQKAIEYVLEGEGFASEYDASYVCFRLDLPYTMSKRIAPALTALNKRLESMMNAEHDLAATYYEEMANV